jgi:threonine dehydrogenase-like Zn-dependent dehydrogenase
MEKTLDYVRKGGTVLLFGVPPRDGVIQLPAFSIFEKGLKILSSYTSVRNSIQSVRLLESGRLDVTPLISHELPLEQFSDGVEMIENGREGVLKVLVKPRQRA